MKELVKFSLKRRFWNSAAILLNVLLCLVVCGVLFADKLIELVNPSLLDVQRIYLNVDEKIENALLNVESGLDFIVDNRSSEEILDKDSKAYVLYYEEGYKLASQYEVPQEMMALVESLVGDVHRNLMLSESLSIEEMEAMNQSYMIENVVEYESIQMNSDKQNLIFMVITSIYFTMLSFSTSVANEVIYEKSTRQLELILTSVSAKTHFLSKMAVGWLAILIQAFLLGSYIIAGGFLRILFDEGRGLILLIRQLGLFMIEQETILEFLSSIPIEFDFIVKILFILFFLMMGILLLQMVLVVISSFIANIEEAGNVQGPFYLILLGIYYFALSVNTPYQMSEGIGFILSFFPFLNMLFMPCRLLIQNVSFIELSLSALISCIFMALILSKGPLVYQRGVLDYTSKGFLGVMKKTLKRSEDHEKK